MVNIKLEVSTDENIYRGKVCTFRGLIIINSICQRERESLTVENYSVVIKGIY